MHATATMLAFPNFSPEITPSTSVQPPQSGTTYVDLIPLPEEWTKLQNVVLGGRRHHNAPWRRCVALLHTLKAETCLVEHHYICLDRKSEIAGFAAQLDAPTSGVSVRLHFFSTRIQDGEQYDLRDKKSSYLGYIVCRVGDAPLVGRAVLKVPYYAEGCSTAVLETVHLLGQRLVVRGVPFMQQDSRYGVCAHVAAWVALYTSFRQGKIGRALISDVVDASATSHAMHPTVPMGFDVRQVLKIFETFGLSAAAYYTFLDGETDIPEIPAELLNVLDQVRVIAAGIYESQELDNGDVALEDYTRQHLADFEDSPIAYAEGTYEAIVLSQDFEPHVKVAAVRLIDTILGTVVRHYIDSRIPLYCDGADHAIALCGIADDDSGPIYYFHDDQYGPYLGSRSLVSISRKSFREQSYTKERQRDAPIGTVASEDRSVPTMIPFYTGVEDDELGIHTVVVPNPPRLLLLPAAALTQSYAMVSEVFKILQEVKGAGAGDLVAPRDVLNFRCVALMGIDYKSQRLAQFRERNDKVGSKFFAEFHLAEWVVVVEVRPSKSIGVQYEFVYDGSSDNGTPLLQMARVKEKIVAFHSKSGTPIEDFVIGAGEFLPIIAPERIGKMYYPDEE